MPKKLLYNRLATRLAVVLTLALLPLGAIAIFSEYSIWQRQKAALEGRLIDRTLESVYGRRALLTSAMDSARQLSPRIADLAENPAQCSAFLAEFIDQSGLFVFAGFISAQGRMECVSHGDVVDFGIEALEPTRQDPRPSFSFQPLGSVTRQPVVLANYPVTVDGRFMGVMTVSISDATFRLITTPLDPGAGLQKVILMNEKGHLLTTTDMADAGALLPSEDDILDFVRAREGNFVLPTSDHQSRVYTVAQLIPGQLYALGIWSDSVTRAALIPNLWRIAFPVLMWLASIGALMLAVHYLVVRHLRQINGQLRRFALGNRDAFQRLPEDAPGELREIDSTFSKMARLISRDEVEREAALKEKTVLLKEVHHRVKNNLQLIASILNLQMRKLKDPQARQILRGVQTRVRALASIHRTLYEETGLSQVEAATFLDALLRDNLALAQMQATPLEVHKNIEPVIISPDKVIPAALLFSEALTNALKFASDGSGGNAPRLDISLQPLGNGAELIVRNSCAAMNPDDTSTGLGRELMTAFALQIGGELDIGAIEDAHGPGWQMRLRLSETQAKTDPNPDPERAKE